jgi:VCBS repeat-containing protein
MSEPVVVQPNGSFVYEPNPDFLGSHTFGDHPSGDASSGTVLHYSVCASSSLSVGAAAGVLAANNPSSATLTARLSGTAPQLGTVQLNADGSFTYTPHSGISSGMDSFTCTLSDGKTSSSGTVTIRIVDPDSSTRGPAGQ